MPMSPDPGLRSSASETAQRVAVVTDSTADFSSVRPADLGVTVVPLTVNWGKDILRDRIDITTSEFYARLHTDPVMPKTAAPPVGILEEVYRNLLRSHDTVISIHLSGKFSGTAAVAASAARAVAKDRIWVLDSTSVSVGLGWLVQSAAELAREGAPAEHVLRKIQEMIPRLRLFLTVDTLEYLQRGGRIGRAQAFLGSILSVKPLLEVRGGEIHPIERVRTRATALRRLGELAAAAGPKEMVTVVHGDCEADAQALRPQVADQEGIAPVPITEIGAVIAAYTGPGIVGVGCLLAQNHRDDVRDRPAP